MWGSQEPRGNRTHDDDGNWTDLSLMCNEPGSPAVLSGGIEEVEHQEGQGKYPQLIMSV